MKVRATRKKVEPKFLPVELKLTFVTKEEMDTFFELFNYVPICDYVRKYAKMDMPKIIRQAIHAVYPHKEAYVLKMDDFLRKYFVI
jgi:hypothetical protein